MAVICFDVMRGDLSECDALGCNAVWLDFRLMNKIIS